MHANFQTEGTYAAPNLLAGDFPREERKKTILSGAGNLAAGTVLAEDSANSDKLVPVDSASGTTSIRAPYAVLAEQADATSADVEAIVYFTGCFNEDALVFGGSDTITTHRDALRQLSIHTRKVGAA